ncbi:MAG: biotin-dependent carboxyltransferase family protein, partial [Acidimicrobiales bacterium]
GAMDEAGLRIANRAVGNREDAAALELLGGRCRIRFGRDAFAALTSEMPLVVEGTEMEAGVVAEVRAGETVEIGPLGTRARAVLAVSGGIRTPFVLASRSSDAMSGLPGGALLAGAELAVGARGRARGRFELLRNESPCLLAVMLGPDELDAARLAPLLGELYLVEQASNRTGLRLDSPSSSRAGAGAAVSTVPSQATVPSHAMVPGAVQLTPSGLPIILGPDCGPVGGYPVAMTVISSDLWRLALLRPGDVISFEAVDRDEATRRLSMLEHRISEAVTGWYPTGFA